MTSCSSFTSSSTSTTSIASIVESKKNDTDFFGARQKSKDVKRRTTGVNVNSLLFLFFFSLTATIFWGRLFAVLFTSIWLYLNPHRSAADTRPENVIKLPETDSRDYYIKNKKKVIMEGLLERNHHRGHLSLTWKFSFSCLLCGRIKSSIRQTKSTVPTDYRSSFSHFSWRSSSILFSFSFLCFLGICKLYYMLQTYDENTNKLELMIVDTNSIVEMHMVFCDQ